MHIQVDFDCWARCTNKREKSRPHAQTGPPSIHPSIVRGGPYSFFFFFFLFVFHSSSWTSIMSVGGEGRVGGGPVFGLSLGKTTLSRDSIPLPSTSVATLNLISPFCWRWHPTRRPINFQKTANFALARICPTFRIEFQFSPFVDLFFYWHWLWSLNDLFLLFFPPNGSSSRLINPSTDRRDSRSDSIPI